MSIPAHIHALAKHGAKFAKHGTMKAHAAKLSPAKAAKPTKKRDMTGSTYGDKSN